MKKILSLIILLSLFFTDFSIATAASTSNSININSIKKTSDAKFEITWNKVPGSDGYRIYRSTMYDGDYTMLKELKTNKYTDNNVTAGTSYYYKVRNFKLSSGKKVFGKYSEIKSEYIKSKLVPSFTVEELEKLKISSERDTIITVTVNAKTSTCANVSLFKKDKNGNWKMYYSIIGYIGKNGIGKTKEGDGKTPIGVYETTAAFGVASKPKGTSIEYVNVDSSHWVVSDSNSKFYNQFVSTKKDGYKTTLDVKQDWKASYGEQLYKYGTAYAHALILNYNEKNIPNKGSAIFFHAFSNSKSTAGCISVPKYVVENTIQTAEYREDGKINITFVIGTKDDMKKF